MSDRLPKLCRHKATGRYYVTLNGAEVYLGSDPNKARSERDRVIAEWLANGRRPVAPDSEELSVAELILRYREFCLGYYRRTDGTPTSEIEGIRAAMKHLRCLYGHQSGSRFTPLALQALRQRFIDTDLCRGVINQHVDRIRRMFKWAVSQELLPPHVYQALATVPGLRAGRTEARETEPIGPVSDELVQATLPFVPPIVADMVRLQRLTGMRPDEVCRLRPCDIDRSGPAWCYKPQHHKTAHHGRQRVIFIGPKAQAVLVTYLLRDERAYCFVPRESEAKRRAAAHEERKTPSGVGNRPGTNRKRKPKWKAGDRYTSNSYRRAIHRACDKAEAKARETAIKEGAVVAEKVRLVARWSPNRLRHSVATEIRKQYGIEAAQTVLGHADPNITLIYAEEDHAKAAAIMTAVG